MINSGHYINIGIRSIDNDEKKLQEGFDIGFKQGMALGMNLGSFIATQTLHLRNTNKDKSHVSNELMSDKVDKLRKLLASDTPLDNYDAIHELLVVKEHPQDKYFNKSSF